MDYVIDFPRTAKGNNLIWIIVDRLKNSTHFIPIMITYSMDQMGITYVKETVQLHGAPVSITSDQDPIFVFRLWQSLQKAMSKI